MRLPTAGACSGDPTRHPEYNAMNRITEKQLEAIVAIINRLTGSPEAAYTADGERLRANIGNFHLSHAYGGVCLHRMTNESGGVSDVFSCGHVSKRELAERMWAFIRGYELAKGA